MGQRQAASTNACCFKNKIKIHFLRNRGEGAVERLESAAGRDPRGGPGGGLRSGAGGDLAPRPAHGDGVVRKHEIGDPRGDLGAESRSVEHAVMPDAGLDIMRLAIGRDRKSTRLNSSHEWITFSVFCLKKQ